MRKLVLSLALLGFISLAVGHGNPPWEQPTAPVKKVVAIPVPVPVPVPVPSPSSGHPGQGKHEGGGGGGGGGLSGTCPKPSAEALRCLREWACQYVIRLDLRCLLTLNGNPLLGNLISLPGITGGGGTSGSGGGILGSLLGK